jgi:FKBP-type peptidyl-prolyl cis-trans isomerase FkpA
LYAAPGYDSPPMSHSLATLRLRIAGTLAGVTFAVLALGACGTLVEVSSQITPPPPDCSTPRPAAASDSFATTVVLTPGPSGLQYADISTGCGAVAKSTANVNVQFTVWLSTGKLVITTRGPSQPANALQLGNSSTLEFWRLGVPGMKVGGTRRLVVPPALGFGTAGNASANVPANATLVVDVELVSIG